MAPPPTLNQQQIAEQNRISFANLVSALTGFDPRVLLVQYNAEGAPGNYPGYFNYGNMPDSTAATLGYPYQQGAYGFADYGNVKTGADATAREYKNLGLGREKGKTIRRQLEDIENSPWASSHYGYKLVGEFQAAYPNVNVDSVASSKATNLTTGGQRTGPGVVQSAGSAISGAIGGAFSGVISALYQFSFMAIGLGLALVGLYLIFRAMMGTGAVPPIIREAERIATVRQQGRRVALSERRGIESERSARVRETQANRRISGQSQQRAIQRQRLAVQSRAVERREQEPTYVSYPRDARFHERTIRNTRRYKST